MHFDVQRSVSSKQTLTLGTKAATRRLGAALGRVCRPGDIIALEGPLGAGKTCLAGGLALGLNIRDPVTSPTFTLVNEYAGRIPFYHVDLYRLGSEQDLVQLGLWEMAESGGVMAVEWLSRFPGALPADRLEVRLDHCVRQKQRVATVTAGGPRSMERLAEWSRVLLTS